MYTYDDLYKIKRKYQKLLDKLHYAFDIVINDKIGDCIPQEFDEDIFILKTYTMILTRDIQDDYFSDLKVAIETVRAANEEL
jgi:hypothetical protein